MPSKCPDNIYYLYTPEIENNIIFFQRAVPMEVEGGLRGVERCSIQENIKVSITYLQRKQPIGQSHYEVQIKKIEPVFLLRHENSRVDESSQKVCHTKRYQKRRRKKPKKCAIQKLLLSINGIRGEDQVPIHNPQTGSEW